MQIQVGSLRLSGELTIPETATGIVLFAHGSGSSRRSPRNQFVARVINDAGIATLLFDLLTREEEVIDNYTRELRFNIELLAQRLVTATDWLVHQSPTAKLVPGYFGASTGGAAALMAAADSETRIGAVVSRGGRPDLAWPALGRVRAPTLLIVGGLDGPVIQLNEKAYAELRCTKELKIVPGATHLFEEPGKLEEVAHLAADWFSKYLK
ncbi:MAG TPA: dienelactone hydrolase family protein [Pyrinomonadaceae bacterium]|nr:dienelactone hydrolase family protein [Pyrinomonadaceae bacterium]